jgi:hypothetical protein
MSFNVKIKTLKKEEYNISLPDGDSSTVLDLKNALIKLFIDDKKYERCEPSECKLCHNGTVLSDDAKKLSDYKVTNGATIIPLIKLNAKPTVEVKQPEPVVATEKVDNDSEENNSENNTTDEARNETDGEDEEEHDGQNNDGVMNEQDVLDEGNFEQMLQTPEAMINMLGQLAMANPQAFMQAMGGNIDFVDEEGLPEGEGDNGVQYVRMPFVQGPQLSDEERQHVQDIIEITNAPRTEVLQYYLALNKDKEATINMIFNDVM